MRNILKCSVIALFLAGCGLTGAGDTIRDAVKTRGAKVFDEGLENASWFVCYGASVGSIRRRFGGDNAKAKTYQDFCKAHNAAILAGAPGPPQAGFPDPASGPIPIR